jgi:hypothetical protein
MSKERFVLRMMQDAARAREEEAERQRRLKFDLVDYLFDIRLKKFKRLHLHARPYR